jgi:ubiquinone/menaquinone biosynthesis C-methylase UbiE
MKESAFNSTTRFSNRVDNYVKYRPHYPAVIIDYLKKENVLKNDSVIADIGSGTGILTEIFLKNGNAVYGIEPNKDMREAGEKYLSGYKNFISINGTAEDTTLKENSIDVISAAQAFHWFNIEKSKKEFSRILKTGGYVVLIWNLRRSDDPGLSVDYEELLEEFGTDYKEVGHREISKKNYEWFFDGKYTLTNFSNRQLLDYDGFKGRLLSSSYAPDERHPNYLPILDKLKKIFDSHQNEGKVEIKYISEVFWGKI